MSKIFYDRFIVFDDIEEKIDSLGLDSEQRQEIEQLIDELVHYRVMDRLLTHLPRQHHADFLDRFHRAPYDEGLLDYIDEKIEESVEEHIKEEIEKLRAELLEDLRIGV